MSFYREYRGELREQKLPVELQPRHAAGAGRLCRRFRHGILHTGIKCLGQDIVRVQFLVADQPGQGVSRRYFHPVVDVRGPDVQGATEDAGETENVVDLVGIITAGGGSGYSPCKMMNEWCLPTVVMQSYLTEIMARLEKEGVKLPHIAVTGGFTMEDQIYKAFALGAPYLKAVGVCRASMAAAMSAKKVGELLEAGNLPPELKHFGTTKEELFPDLRELRNIYGKKAKDFSTGAIGVYSYLNRIAFGLKHFAALNRKFDIKYIDKSDIFPLTRDAKDLMDGKWLK